MTQKAERPSGLSSGAALDSLQHEHGNNTSLRASPQGLSQDSQETAPDSSCSASSENEYALLGPVLLNPGVVRQVEGHLRIDPSHRGNRQVGKLLAFISAKGWRLLGRCSGHHASPHVCGKVGRLNARHGASRATCKCSLRRRPPDSLERFRAPSPSGIGCIRTTRWAWPRQVQQRASQSLRARNVPGARQVAARLDPHSQQYRSPRTKGWDGTQGAGYAMEMTR
jgi:hypothetical protein